MNPCAWSAHPSCAQTVLIRLPRMSQGPDHCAQSRIHMPVPSCQSLICPDQAKKFAVQSAAVCCPRAYLICSTNIFYRSRKSPLNEIKIVLVNKSMELDVTSVPHCQVPAWWDGTVTSRAEYSVTTRERRRMQCREGTCFRLHREKEGDTCGGGGGICSRCF
jgi:hypothetical protein